ncbi:MAG: hypothetical protein QM802_25390 [Agriterribacter sp.]
MNDSNIGSVFKTILRVDQRLETVKGALHEALEDEQDWKATHTEQNNHNSFVLGWVKSFTIIMISITLKKESEHSTSISIETTNTEEDGKTKRIIHDGFYDFLAFLKGRLLPVETRNSIFSEENDYKSSWAWVFFILFALFMSWYFFER